MTNTSGSKTLTLPTIRQRARSARRFSCGLVLIAAMLLASNVMAAYEYTWLTTSGPSIHATFRVADSVVASGVISAADISGFTATTPVGTFTNVTAGSALGVNPATGLVMASTNGITATNLTDTLMISRSAFYVPSSLLQSKGKGVWTVTRLSDIHPNLRLGLPSFSNGQPQLQISSDADTSFILESSTDLLHWSPILTNKVMGGTLTISDPQTATDQVCFYRAVTAP